ncbi:alpha/beta fold hydrolase [Bordetella genomosp. 9]|uniref:alpha/beta fold hydrolase n=1 Tax=Bordetella genomosp. 9 TaxID=1416803 RepID=UPI00211B50BF|nr:alpha/beta fold hydrolase [Bordetella genomosp. 9]
MSLRGLLARPLAGLFVLSVFSALAAAVASPAMAAPDAAPSAVPSAAPAAKPPLVLEDEGSFFVGGRERASETLSLTQKYDPRGTVTVDQMYVQYQVPVNAKPYSITLIHGCCLTGKTWETTPDGRMGWNQYFVRKGYATYTIDQAGRGRSATDISGINAVHLGKAAPDSLPAVFAAGHEAAWTIFRFGPKYPEAYADTQFPVQAQAELWQQMVPDWLTALPTPNPTVADLSKLAIKLKGTVLMSHSQSGIYPFQTAALNKTGVAGIVAVEPGECPKVEEARALVGIPILVVFGDHVQESSRWAPRFKACQDFIAAFTSAGGTGEFMSLPAMGIHGNSHMMMQDRNNLQVADLILGWIDRNVEGAGRTASAAAATPPTAGNGNGNAGGTDAARHHVLVQAAPDVRIDVIEEGAGRPLVLLPSRGRGAEDFDDVARRLAGEGYRVLRPQPRGIGQSTGPMDNITLHDLANDVAAVIRDQVREPVVIVGHAFGNWVARTASVDHPELVRGVVILAAAAKQYPPGLSEHVDRSGDLSLPDAERLKSLQYAFFAPGHDASVWLTGWYPRVNESERLAGKATRQSDWWSGGSAPMLDLQAGDDPFKPAATRTEVKDEFGDRVTMVVIPGAGHALVPESPAAVVDAIARWERSLPSQQ